MTACKIADSKEKLHQKKWDNFCYETSTNVEHLNGMYNKTVSWVLVVNQDISSQATYHLTL